MKIQSPKITVYAPCFNYGAFVEQAVESVIAQTFEDWELIVIDDGSTDNSREILRQYADHPKIRVIEQENKGLNVTNNIALRLARGEYVMRLDTDDWLDENALVVLSGILDRDNDVGLVYPDYFEVDEQGDILELVRRKKLGDEVELLDLPAHGACTMFRRDVLMQMGGYIEDYSCQDGYELWIRFIQKFHPYNVNIPLFYYRQHGTSLTAKQDRILSTRRTIKRDFVAREFQGVQPNVMGLIPVGMKSPYPHNDPFQSLGGRPLIDHTLDQALAATALDQIVVSTRRKDVLEYIANKDRVIGIERPDGIGDGPNGTQKIARHALDRLDEETEKPIDAVCILYISTPFREAHHIDWAIDTMQIFGTDSVISVQEELAPFHHHGRHGLEPLNATPGMRLERDAMFRENGAIFLTKRSVIDSGRLMGEVVGHVTMLPEESVKINSEFEYWLAEKIAAERRPHLKAT